jgi:hypothetical protein
LPSLFPFLSFAIAEMLEPNALTTFVTCRP